MSIVQPGDSEPNRLIDRPSACFRLGISAGTLDKLVRTGELPVYRIGRAVRFRLGDLDAFVDTLRSEVAG